MTSSSPVAYQRLGRRTLAVFLFSSVWVLILVLVILGALIALLAVVPTTYTQLVATVIAIGVILGVVAIAGAFITTWLRYTHYGIALGEADFKFKHGIVAVEEIGIPYRRIKEVKIERGPTELIFGVSNLVITVAEEEEDPRESQLTIASLEKNFAEQLNEELLKRAEVEKVDDRPEADASADTGAAKPGPNQIS